MPNWTREQEDAIYARKGTVLVSAAAGSGKTAVLVERVIKALTREENPIDADRLLVVTFTKAAAAEMRGRIEKALNKEIQKKPLNPQLRRQKVLLSQANISTVDSFCAKLSREYFQELGIAPDFKILSDQQEKEMKIGAMEELMVKVFQDDSAILADTFSSDRSDKTLSEIILKLYNFTGSHLFPEKWLDDKLKDYDSSCLPGKTPWGQVLIEYGLETVSYCQNLVLECLRLIQEDKVLEEKLLPIFNGDKLIFEKLSNCLPQGDFDKIADAISSVKFDTFRAPKDYKDDPLKLLVQKIRESYKKIIKEKISKIFSYTNEQANSDLIYTYNIAENLSQAVKDFSNIYRKMKEEKGFADYSDIEHYAVRLFLKDENGFVLKTQLAEEYSNRFDEIMIDEYQDTNTVQDCIFRAISKSENNLFMVGDVKQSIYSFRQAMPEIFINYKNKYTLYNRADEKHPATIILNKNFRSRPEVIDSVNFVFSQLMTPKVGGTEYVGDEALSLGLNPPQKELCETQLDFLEKNSDEPQEITEAKHIAATIKKLLSKGITVTEDGAERKASYKDFCILLRSANRYGFSYSQELSRLGVPAWASVTGSFFDATEVQIALAFLQVIDNPDNDIPLLAVMLSPIYGFTADDVARLRVNNKDSSIYVSLINSKEDEFKKLLSDIEEYRLLAASMPSDVFINSFYNRTGLDDVVLAMENGESRLANLRKLSKYAADYESSGYMGISSFVRFMKKLMDAGSDMEAANLVSENADVVRIMSIHKSKGLEFPFCIVAGCGRKFNFDRDNVYLNAQLGIGIKIKEDGISYSSFIRDAVNRQNNNEANSEELRVFYVAMTRAREKLIMISTIRDVNSLLAKTASQLSSETSISNYVVNSANSISDWLIACGLRHPNGTSLRARVDASDSIIYRGYYTPWSIRVIASENIEEKEDISKSLVVYEPDMELVKEVKENCDYVYPFKEINLISAKMTASAVAAEQEELTLSRPSFMSYKGLTPAERGTALHNFMQFSDFELAEKDLKAELQRLVDKEFITKEQAGTINLNQVKKFLASSLGQRIINSDRYEKEKQFSVIMEAGLLQVDLPKEVEKQEVILQGAVDCCFVQDGKLHIVDFKTDKVENMDELAQRYGIQLLIYAKALEKLAEIPIGSCYLYSLYLGADTTV